MTGSVVDGEDVVEDTLATAFYLLPQTPQIANLRSWIFRIAHNKAIDYTRRYARRFGESLDQHADIAADPAHGKSGNRENEPGPVHEAHAGPARRRHINGCPGPLSGRDRRDPRHQRSRNQRLAQSGSALGRAPLRKLGQSAGESAPPLDRSEVSLLENYVRHFVSRDFDKLRELLAEDVRLDVVRISQARQREPGGRLLSSVHRTS